MKEITEEKQTVEEDQQMFRALEYSSLLQKDKVNTARISICGSRKTESLKWYVVDHKSILSTPQYTGHVDIPFLTANYIKL